MLLALGIALFAVSLFRWLFGRLADNWVAKVAAPIARVVVAFVPAPVRTRLAQWRVHAHQPTGPPRDTIGFAFA
jgi:uncharacterized membrane protein